MRAALLAVKDFPAASGRTTFMPNGEARKELFILAVEKAEKSGERSTIKELGRVVP
jgi:hypothetical protein